LTALRALDTAKPARDGTPLAVLWRHARAANDPNADNGE
jgi:hypothetical protein